MSANVGDGSLQGLKSPFSTFLLSLGSSAMFHLGVKAAQDVEPEINLPLAKQTIEILEMLELKTRGNLTEDEQELHRRLLYDLRMRYVEAKRKA